MLRVRLVPNAMTQTTFTYDALQVLYILHASSPAKKETLKAA